MNTVETGAKAPLWKLSDQNEKIIDLNEYLGKYNILLSFHPLAWTSICAQQMLSLERHYDDFVGNDTIPFGLSVDSVPCKKAWAESLKIGKLSIPSDFWPHGGVAQLYGVFDEVDGVSERANFIINKQGIVVFKKTYPRTQLPDINEVVAKVKELAGVPA